MYTRIVALNTYFEILTKILLTLPHWAPITYNITSKYLRTKDFD